MRIGFLINDLADELPIHTTTLLAYESARRGHQISYLELDRLRVTARGRVDAVARRAQRAPAGPAELLAGLRAATPAVLAVDELDVLMVRSEPSFEAITRPWAQSVGFQFGELARRAGVRVLSDPRGLALAGPDKLYTLRFPAELRPATLITRELEDVRAFAGELGTDLVLKPLHGGAGESVFLLRQDDPNRDQIFEAVARRGYVIAQQFLPEIADGSIRLFLLDGVPLSVGGALAASRHLPQGRDIRSNYRVAGTITAVEPDARLSSIAAAVGPILAADGMFLVGLDIVGDKVLEANLHSPGGLRGAQLLTGADFTGAVVDAMTGVTAAIAAFTGAGPETGA